MIAEKTKNVFFIRETTYNIDNIKESILKLIDLADISLPHNSYVLIKPNVLGAYTPDKNVTTNPNVVAAVAELLIDNGNRVVIGDSSGMPVKDGTKKALFDSGLKKLEEKYPGIKVIPFEEVPAVSLRVENPYVLDEVKVTGLITEVDYIINLPKLKAHQLTRYTGAVKNFYGCIPGGLKQQYHAMASKPLDFSNLLLDLYSVIRDKVLFSLMDAIVSLEGHGPGPTGTPANTGFLALSSDAVALDIACCRATGMDPETIMVNKLGVARNLGSNSFDLPDFTVPVMQYPVSSRLGWLGISVSRLVRTKPYVKANVCKSCSYCARVCPVSCITMKDGLPYWDYKKCIYCYCCHENCPHKAIDLKEPLVLKLYKIFSGR
ncbi:DUF362 domain-containing protein [Spirochaetia bacterium 38H-sp]|uniref:DUF362 domain-containing protein n=1 Tax=Rarispira pelagica TaxID=3141764 RepID=A0ABU9UCJ8_9SPIR